MLKRLSLVGFFLALPLAAPPAASAETQIPPPEAGVRARLVDGTIASMRFSPSLFRELAGKRVVIACTEMSTSEGPGITSEGIGSEAFRMPKRRRVVRRFVGRGYDYCTLRAKRRHIVTFATSERGAIVVDEQYRTYLMLTALSSDAAVRSALRVVPLAAPSDTPPAGSIGYYSDGGEHAAVVMLSDAGRRLFVEVNADDVLYTNVAQYLSGGIF